MFKDQKKKKISPQKKKKTKGGFRPRILTKIKFNKIKINRNQVSFDILG